MDEKWYMHPVYISYECSPNGNIRNRTTRQIKVATVKHDGYAQVSIYRSGHGSRACAVHRLVYEAVSGRLLGPDELITHIDGDRENNAFHNLDVVHRGDQLRMMHAKRRDRDRALIAEYDAQYA